MPTIVIEISFTSGKISKVKAKTWLKLSWLKMTRLI